MDALTNSLRVVSALTLAQLILFGCFSDKGPTTPIIPVEPEFFPTDVSGLPTAGLSKITDVGNGDTLNLEAYPVKKIIKGFEVRMLGFNGTIPGPTIRVRQGSEIILKFKNRLGFPNALHSHGLRLDNQSDGNQHATQSLVANESTFTYRLRFPDPGVYWYHPHHRTDYFLEMGLYGNYLVIPSDSTYWGSVNREELLVVDDFLLDTTTGKPPPSRTKNVDYTMMGRFGNIFFVNGDTGYHLTVKRKERIRFYLTNTSSTRVFNVGLAADTGKGIPNIKVVGSDNGRYEVATLLPRDIVAPTERMIFEAYFDTSGTVLLVHTPVKSAGFSRIPPRVVLGRITVLDDSVETPYGEGFTVEDTSFQTLKSIDSVRNLWQSGEAPDQELFLTGVMNMVPQSQPAAKVAVIQHDPGNIEAKGIEWEDIMPEMNKISDLKMMSWFIRDLQTGLSNHDIKWSFKTGEKVKIRIKNNGDPKTNSHVMPHPIHFHGQRFLVMFVNGRRNHNMAWKDTHLIGMSETVDILLDAGNPGVWMAQCHIAEHSESSMMFHFTVE